MITVQFMKPFYTKVSGTKLRLVFANKYLSIVKDEEVYQFIPIEGKEMLISLETKQVENLSEVFVFQRGNRFIRLPLYQLLLVSNVQEHLELIIGNEITVTEPQEVVSDREVEEIILHSLIDRALDVGDKTAFMELTEQLKGRELDYATTAIH